MSKRISFQGVDGAYSQLAVNDFFSGAETLPCKTFEIALNEAEVGNVDYAMIPIENSAAGRVADIHYLLPKYKLQIHGEHFQPVEHNLLCKPDAKIEDIKYWSGTIKNIYNALKLNKRIKIIKIDKNKSADIFRFKDFNIVEFTTKACALDYDSMDASIES